MWEQARRREMAARRSGELSRTLRAHARVGLSRLGYRAVRRPGATLAATIFVAAHVAGLLV